MRSSKRLAAATAAAAMFAALLLVVPAGMAGASGRRGTPAWAGNPRLDAAGDLVARLSQGRLPAAPPGNQGSPCPAEANPTGNVQVNCLGEDGTSPQNTESETSVAASGKKVVVGFNDSLVCCFGALNLTGYSVFADGGKTFTDEGDLPWQPTVQPIGDPAVARDGAGNFFFASLALNSPGVGAHSLLAFYEMPAGSDTFRLVSVPVDVGSDENFFADK